MDQQDGKAGDERRPLPRRTYLYDFGDGWEHTVRLEEVAVLERDADGQAGVALGAESAAYGVRCLAGERACPPEDIGGPYVYNQVADWVRGGHDPATLAGIGWDPEDLREWLGEWEPDAFDLEAVNRALAWVRVRG